MLYVEAERKHVGKAFLYLFLKAFLIVGVVSLGEQSGGGHLLGVVHYDVYPAKGYHAAEVGGVFAGMNIVLLDDTEGCLVAVADRIDYVATQCTVEEEFSLGIYITDRHGVWIAVVAQ